MKLVRRLALVSVLASMGCSGGDGGDGSAVPGAGEGSACSSGQACAEGLACFVTGDDPESGSCITPPAACGNDLSCSCFDELAAACSTGVNCFGIFSKYTLGCSTSTLRQEGETCSRVRPCEVGSYCMISNPSEPGQCIADPPGCDTSTRCDCYEAVRQSCSGGSSCFRVADITTITCH